MRSLVVLVLSLLACTFPVRAQRLSPLVKFVEWSRLEQFQETMTREEFQQLLDTVYAPGGAAAGVIEVRETDAVIHTRLTPPETMLLRFAKDKASAKKLKNYWSTAPKTRARKPLSGLTIALDPGHIGGKWGLMEERSFAVPGDPPVQEGDMTLLVAKLMAPKLRALGAEVQMVRSKPGPTTPFEVEAFNAAAQKELDLLGIADVRERYDGPRDPLKAHTVQWQAEKLFYRVAEIRERGRKVNTKLKPDVVVCIHFNADDWADPSAPVFTDRNDLHVLVHGCYSAGELRFDDQRFEMLLKLLNRSHPEEAAASGAVIAALRKATGLPAFAYTTGNAVRADAEGYLWARNLLANRLYECPTIFLEPYRMNHAEAYARMQAGDYPGEREIAGKKQKSIFREYADAVVEGLRDYYSAARTNGKKAAKSP
jgi:hypothetical protein